MCVFEVLGERAWLQPVPGSSIQDIVSRVTVGRHADGLRRYPPASLPSPPAILLHTALLPPCHRGTVPNACPRHLAPYLFCSSPSACPPPSSPQVRRDEFIPADLMFIACDNEDGTCYIETMNLDGETNLKIKKALDATKDLRPGSGDDVGMLAEFRGKIQCEPPNSRLYQFTGNLITGEGGIEKVPLNPAAILLRGCSLRNTEVVYGAVIYAGVCGGEGSGLVGRGSVGT